jgi:integrase
MDAVGLNDPATVAAYGRATIHSLRHTFASWLIQNGADLGEVADALGHTSLNMTKRYAHLSKSGTVAKLGGILNAVSGSTAPAILSNVGRSTDDVPA